MCRQPGTLDTPDNLTMFFSSEFMISIPEINMLMAGQGIPILFVEKSADVGDGSSKE